MPLVPSRTFGRAAPKRAPSPVPAPAPTVRATSENEERRCLMAGLQLRAAMGGKGPGTVVGYAAVVGKFSQDLGGFYEQIAPDAFNAVLSQDVRALVNHDANKLIGRSKSGTLRMSTDLLGLRVEIDLPDTQVGRDTAEDIRRGDMDGMSFSFVADADSWDNSGAVPIRTLLKVRDLYDVGPVVFPAYTDTSAALRSLDQARSAAAPAPAPDPVHQFDPVSHLHFRLRVEQASVLP